MEEVMINIDKIHTTELGALRIKNNLSIETDDVVAWCKNLINRNEAVVTKRGKNWYVRVDKIVFTINIKSLTIITAHLENNKS